jgi:hypothetical protein
VKDYLARALSGLALGGVFILYSMKDHGGWHAFDIVLALWWTLFGTAYLILGLFFKDEDK